MARRTIHHEHDISGGAFLGLLSLFPVFGLLMAAGGLYVGFLAVQDWLSGETLSPSQYEIDISEADARFIGVEQATAEQTMRIVNRSDMTLTRVVLDRRVYTCPAGTDDLARCNKVKQRQMHVDVTLAPGEGATRNIGEHRLHLVGTKGNETIRVQTRIDRVESDTDKEA